MIEYVTRRSYGPPREADHVAAELDVAHFKPSSLPLNAAASGRVERRS